MQCPSSASPLPHLADHSWLADGPLGCCLRLVGVLPAHVQHNWGAVPGHPANPPTTATPPLVPGQLGIHHHSDVGKECDSVWCVWLQRGLVQSGQRITSRINPIPLPSLDPLCPPAVLLSLLSHFPASPAFTGGVPEDATDDLQPLSGD